MEISFTVSDLMIGRVQGFAFAVVLLTIFVLVRGIVRKAIAIVTSAVAKLRGFRLVKVEDLGAEPVAESEFYEPVPDAETRPWENPATEEDDSVYEFVREYTEEELRQ